MVKNIILRHILLFECTSLQYLGIKSFFNSRERINYNIMSKLKRLVFYPVILLGIIFIFSCHEEAADSGSTFAGEHIDKNMKLTGAYNFAQYHRSIRTPEGADGPNYPANYKVAAYNKAVAALRKSGQKRSVMDWTERGPGNITGRARSLWVDPSDATGMTVYIGSVGGGVWKTTDGGVSWANLGNDLPNLATARIAGSPSNPQVLYLGTGEDYGAGDEINGSGIWKSIDGGQTGRYCPLQMATYLLAPSMLSWSTRMMKTMWYLP